jgi:DNA polymerase III subunit gamma/tau
MPSKKEKSKEPKQIVSQSLAVKYRPRHFKDLVGQESAVAVIRGMFKSGKFPGAILLEGQTGGGKTTVARMLLAYLNCDTHNACGKCDSCLMGVETHPDLVYVNAGADGGIDNMRRLDKLSKITPRFNKRIILIDEAHKITGAASEAILVPLEEPKANTIWILCTTEPDSLKDTLRNRCTRIVMRPLRKEDIVKRLTQVVDAEGIKIKEKVLNKCLGTIADISNGSMREAISLLEPVLYAIQGGAEATDETVLKSFIQNSEVDVDKAAAHLVLTLLNGKYKESISVVRQCNNNRALLSKTLWLLDYIIGAQTNTAKFVPYYGRVFNELAKKEGAKVSFSRIMLMMRFFTDCNIEFNRTSVGENFLLQSVVARYAEEMAE